MKSALLHVAGLAGAVAAAALSAAQVSAAEAEKPYNPRELAGVWIQQTRAPNFGALMPYTPQYAKILNDRVEAIKAGKPYRNDGGTCLPRGLIGVMTTGSVIHPIEIFQTGDRVMAINMETAGSFFRIHLNRQHKPADEQFQHFFGENVGHWEGDVLVVDSINLGKMRTFDAQAPSSPDMHVVQRIRRTAYDILENDITFEDPKALSHPVTVNIKYKLDPVGELDEAVCENERHNYDDQGNTLIAQSPAP